MCCAPGLWIKPLPPFCLGGVFLCCGVLIWLVVFCCCLFLFVVATGLFLFVLWQTAWIRTRTDWLPTCLHTDANLAFYCLNSFPDDSGREGKRARNIAFLQLYFNSMRTRQWPESQNSCRTLCDVSAQATEDHFTKDVIIMMSSGPCFQKENCSTALQLR